MILPPVATIAACGSILTACKSGWELMRMLEKKGLENELKKEANGVSRELQLAYLDGHIDEQSFEKWYTRFSSALADKDTVELRKLRQRIKLIRTAEARLTQRNTKANRSSNYHDEKHVSRKSAHEPRSHDSHGGSSSSSSSRRRRYSYSAASSRAPEYSVHEYEEERRRPSHVDTVKAQRDYYYAHALPSPYRGMIEDTPRDEDFDEDDKERGRRGGERHGGREKGRRHDEDRGHGQGQGGDTKSSRTETYRSRSNSTYHRGRPRSRSSVTTERKQERVVEVVSSDADSEAEAEKDRDRRRKRHSSYGGGHERGREFRRRSEWVDA